MGSHCMKNKEKFRNFTFLPSITVHYFSRSLFSCGKLFGTDNFHAMSTFSKVMIRNIYSYYFVPRSELT